MTRPLAGSLLKTIPPTLTPPRTTTTGDRTLGGPLKTLTWHRSLKTRFGLDEANSRFINAWQKQGIGSEPLNARSFDTSFRDYAKANGFFDALYYGLGSLAKPIGVTTDVVSGVSAGISSTASLTKYIIPIAAVILAYMAFTAYAPRRK